MLRYFKDAFALIDPILLIYPFSPPLRGLPKQAERPLNLLDDPLIDCGRPASLPGVLAAMARDEVRGFPALRPHQRAAWHMFTVQLAALAIECSGQGDPPQDEGRWRALLLALTGDAPGPWALTGPDDSPAFLQPPVPSGLKWTRVETPDALDLLITSRNHDVKQTLMRQSEPQHWIFALVSLQTSEGYGGKGNCGIARMNGGSSSRAMLGFVPGGAGGPDPSVWWRRDVQRLLALRAQGDHGIGTAGGPALLWLEPWAEGAQLFPAQLDPWFIEVCRRVRLEPGLVARRSTSAKPRVEAKAFKGVLGDPWAPVSAKDEKSLTLGEGRFDYKRMCDLLFSGAWHRPALAQPLPEEGAGYFVAEALARGNSKTDGWHSRVIPVPATVVNRMFGAQARASEQTQAMLKEVAVFDQAIRNALAVAAGDGDWTRVGKEEYARARGARDAFDAHVDRAFFPALWRRLEADQAARSDWLRGLRAAAEAETAGALPSVPMAAQFRPRAEHRAWRAFWGHLSRNTELVGIEEEGDGG